MPGPPGNSSHLSLPRLAECVRKRNKTARGDTRASMPSRQWKPSPASSVRKRTRSRTVPPCAAGINFSGAIAAGRLCA
jgi:hypothetical protein